MGRKCLGDKPLTGAEAQKRYRSKQKSIIQALKDTPGLDFEVNVAAVKEKVKKELGQELENELKIQLEAEKSKLEADKTSLFEDLKLQTWLNKELNAKLMELESVKAELDASKLEVEDLKSKNQSLIENNVADIRGKAKQKLRLELEEEIRRDIFQEVKEEAKRELIKDFDDSYQEERKAARLDAERREGQRLAKLAAKNRKFNDRWNGRIAGICEVAGYFLDRNRADIALTLVKHYCIEKDSAEVALEPDKRSRSELLEDLEKAGIWGTKKP